MISPHDFLQAVIGTWEGLYSDDSDDPGNWENGQLVGSMRGVTASVLAEHRHVDVNTITPSVIKTVTIVEAADIGMELFYKGDRFDLLTWTTATAELLDFGWGSGDGQAARSMQRIVGAEVDGVIGPQTAHAYNDWLMKVGAGAAAVQIHDMRCDFYRTIASNSVLAKYLRGWLNRADWALKAAV